MSISERVRVLHDQLTAYREFGRNAGLAEKFRERATELQLVRAQLDGALARANVLKISSGMSPTELAPLRKLPSPTKALESISLVKHKLAEAPLSLNEGRDYATLRQRVGRCAEDTVEAVSKALDAVKAGIPSVDETFLKQVEGIAAYEKRVRDIRAKRDELLAGVELRTADAAGVEAFLKRRAALRGLTDGLDPKEFPEEVLAFFRAVRKGGATLDAFTDGVRNWLGERDLLKKIRVILGH